MLNFIKEIKRRKNLPSKEIYVSLENRNAFLDYPIIIKRIRTIILAMVLVMLMLSFTVNNAIGIVLIWLLSIIVAIKQMSWIRHIRRKVSNEFSMDILLLEFILNNNLYTDKDILRSAVLSYEELPDKLIIYAIKYGDIFSSRLETLDTELSALLNLPLTEKLTRAGVVEYHFQTKVPERLHVISTNEKEVIETTEISIGNGVIYNPVKCPHILISGGTGSGKSVFISFMLIQFLRQGTGVILCDLKNSDLGALSHYLGDEKVATTPNNIARVIRLAVAEMQERYKYMSDNFQYGANYQTHGFKAAWILFDEIGAFSASGTDKKSKEVVNEVMDGIKQIILLGRQAGFFILIAGQQVNASNLSTELRDNLGLRIALGQNSSEGYKMVLGSATPDKIPPIEVKGAGLLYMQGSGKEKAQYWESPYIDMENFDFIAELEKYI
ncbi:TPA: FtsK/SpoIIIE domain-containing protein [Enterococcus faecalis]